MSASHSSEDPAHRHDSAFSKPKPRSAVGHQRGGVQVGTCPRRPWLVVPTRPALPERRLGVPGVMACEHLKPDPPLARLTFPQSCLVTQVAARAVCQGRRRRRPRTEGRRGRLLPQPADLANLRPDPLAGREELRMGAVEVRLHARKFTPRMAIGNVHGAMLPA